MKYIALTTFTILTALMTPLAAIADEVSDELLIIEASEVEVDTFQWTNRVLLIFADSENDPRFVSQMALIAQDTAALTTRDVVVVTDTDPTAKSPLRQKFRSRGFSLVLLAKDGTVTLRKPRPWPMRDISHSIDKLPLRRQEIRDGR